MKTDPRDKISAFGMEFDFTAAGNPPPFRDMSGNTWLKWHGPDMPPPAPTPETDAVNADDRQSLLEHARRLERQRDSCRREMLQAFSAYMGASKVAHVAIGLIETSLLKGLHHSRPALEAALPELKKQLYNASKGPN